MNLLMKWTLLFAALLVMIHSGYAWNIGAKGRVVGPSIHTTYFLTPNNSTFLVHAQAFVGSFVNGLCQHTTSYDLGNAMLQSGNTVDIDAFALKSVIGLGYNCMSIYYINRQQVIETFQLVTDGINYINTIPATTQVMIL